MPVQLAASSAIRTTATRRGPYRSSSRPASGKPSEPSTVAPV
nr:hypothetical protein [Salinibacter ruber]